MVIISGRYSYSLVIRSSIQQNLLVCHCLFDIFYILYFGKIEFAFYPSNNFPVIIVIILSHCIFGCVKYVLCILFRQQWIAPICGLGLAHAFMLSLNSFPCRLVPTFRYLLLEKGYTLTRWQSSIKLPKDKCSDL